MGRSIAWRRNRNELIVAKLVRADRSIWYQSPWIMWGVGLDYEKRNSIDEVVTVKVLTPYHYQEYRAFQAKLRRDNRTECSCCHCGNPRRHWRGSAKKTLTFKERVAAFSAHESIMNCDVRMTNSTWRAHSASRCKIF